MATLLMGAISVAAFSTFGMAINTWIEFTNKDFKFNKKSKEQGGEENVTYAINKDLRN